MRGDPSQFGSPVYRKCGYTIWYTADGVRIEKEGAEGVERVVFAWVPALPIAFGLLILSLGVLMLLNIQWRTASPGVLAGQLTFVMVLLTLAGAIFLVIPKLAARAFYAWRIELRPQPDGSLWFEERIGWFRSHRRIMPPVRLLVRPTWSRGDWGFEHKLAGSNTSRCITMGPRMGFNKGKTAQKHARDFANAIAAGLHCDVEYHDWKRTGGKDRIDESSTTSNPHDDHKGARS